MRKFCCAKKDRLETYLDTVNVKNIDKTDDDDAAEKHLSSTSSTSEMTVKKHSDIRWREISDPEIAEKIRLIRRDEDCGECLNCLDKPKFGGKFTRKQMCSVKKDKLVSYMNSVATWPTQRSKAAEADDDSAVQGHNEESEVCSLKQRCSQRKRKLTCKMEESLVQKIHGELMSMEIGPRLLYNVQDRSYCSVSCLVLSRYSKYRIYRNPNNKY